MIARPFHCRLRFLVAALTLLTAGTAHAETLQDVINDALKNHPEIAAKEASENVSVYDIKEQKSSFFPTISASASAGRQFADNDTTRGLTADGGGDYSWLGDGNVTVTQMLFDAREASNRVAAAKARQEAAHLGVTDSQESVALRAAQAQLGVMRARELIKLARAHIQGLEQHQKKIELMYQEGALDEAEILQAQELMVSAQAKLMSFEEQLGKAEAGFLEAVGRAPEPVMEVATPWQKNLPENLETAIAIGQRESPDIAASEKTAVAYAHDARAEKARTLPRVNAEMSYYERDQGDTVGGESASAQALLKMSWSLSTGGAERARIQRAHSRKAEAEAQQEEMRRRIEQQVRTAYVDLESARKQHGLLTQREEANRKIVEKFRQQFEAGTRTSLQIMGMEARLFDSTADRISGDYRLVLSNLQYLASMGRLRDAVLSEYSLAPEGGHGSNG